MRNKNARVPDPNKIFSNPGDRYQVQYSSKVNDDGTVTLVPSGKIDIQEFINSFRESTDMAFILTELQRGNFAVLDQRTPMYGDFTEVPKSMVEFHQRILDGQRAFETLSLDVRNKYNNDMWQWMADTGSDKWLEAMKEYLPAVESSESEVVEDA